MIRITINNQQFEITPSQLSALNEIVAHATVLKEVRINNKWVYTPNLDAAPMRLEATTIVEWTGVPDAE